jgi:hypothetical protein
LVETTEDLDHAGSQVFDRSRSGVKEIVPCEQDMVGAALDPDPIARVKALPEPIFDSAFC